MENGEEEFTDQFFASTEGRNDIRREKIKKLIFQIRQDTLRQVLMSEEYVAGLFTDKLLAELYNNTIKNKAKEIWGIDLSKD